MSDIHFQDDLFAHHDAETEQFCQPQDRAADTLKAVFGYDHFKPLQAEAIGELLAGRNALVLLPTGGGKSLCYQIPAIIRTGTAVVVSPLLSLMQDQVSALLKRGVKAGKLNSMNSPQESLDTEQAFREGQLDLLYVAPERLLTQDFLTLLKAVDIALFAIDEAHCVSQWGHDFRPDYTRLGVLAEQFPDVPRLALTATADPHTRADIIDQLSLEGAVKLIGGFDRPNIRYQIETGKPRSREALLHFIQSQHQGNSGIVYCSSRKGTEELAEWLSRQGVEALAYHAKISKGQRNHIQHRFQSETGLIIVATIAFGMGIDKPDVRFVAHFNLPDSIESYYQETGRAGRDGLPADAWMNYSAADSVMIRQRIHGKSATDAYKLMQLTRLSKIESLCEIPQCRRQAILAYFGEYLGAPCGNCDNCQDPPKTFDGTAITGLALSAVFQTGNRFGSAHLINVLQGKHSDKVSRLRHDRLPVFGKGKQWEKSQWMNVYRQLSGLGFLEICLEGFGLKFTEKAERFLQTETDLALRELPVKREKPRRPIKSLLNQSSFTKATAAKELNCSDTALWENLRTARMMLAEKEGVKAFQIFHDKTLLAILAAKPANKKHMLSIPGIGHRKLDLYGETVLAVLASTQQKVV